MVANQRDKDVMPSPQMAEIPSEVRRARRNRVLKRAQLVFGTAGSTIDCLVIDESPLGLQLETPLMLDLPEYLKVRVAGGVEYDAYRRWSVGNKIGIEFTGKQRLDPSLQRKWQAVAEALKTSGLPVAIRMLEDVGFFNNDQLRAAAEGAEKAFARLSRLLE